MVTSTYLSSFKSELSKIAQDNLNGEIHKEREKRFKLDELPYEIKDIKPTNIKQGVLREVKDGDKIIAYARVRHKKEHQKDPEYSLGVKHFPLKQEVETKISKEMFEAFFPVLKKTQEKKRYSLKNGWDIDHTTDGKIIAEYEHSKNEDIKVPKHWKIQKD